MAEAEAEAMRHALEERAARAVDGEEKREECAKNTSQAPVIDLTDHGIFKLLGKGQLPNQPVVVKCRYISKLAEKKIKEVGGACLLTA